MDESRSFRLLNPIAILLQFMGKRELILHLTVQEFIQRYQGTFLGFLWTFLNPLFMLCVYTFVFSVILNAKWEMPDESKPALSYFAFMVFAGLIPYQMLSETMNRSSELISGKMGYVRKIKFPLEILPLVSVLAGWLHSLINVMVLLVAVAFWFGELSPSIVMLPLAYLPVVFMCLGFGWFLSSIGIFMKDIKQIMLVVTQMLFFLSPIVYPDTAIPEPYRWILHFNPLASTVYDFRRILLLDSSIAWYPWGRWTIVSMIFAWLGYFWFMKIKRAFATFI